MIKYCDDIMQNNNSVYVLKDSKELLDFIDALIPPATIKIDEAVNGYIITVIE